MTVWILGLNAFHADAAACLVRDGELVAAAEEERFRRVKHWGGFPTRAIAYCLDEGGIGLGDIGFVAINRDGRANFLRKLVHVVRHRPSLRLLRSRLANRRQWLGIADLLNAEFPGHRFDGVVCPIEHHEAHLASAFLVSPFDRAAVVSVDGFGDFASAAWALGDGSGIGVGGHVLFPHSLGIFYEGLTQYLGFPYYGDEYKVMGLAPYGEATFRRALERVLLLQNDGTFRLNTDYFTHVQAGANYEIREGVPSGGRLFSPALEELLGPARRSDEPLEQRHRDLARSVQAAYEDAFFNLLGRVHRDTRSDSLALAGGCAQNSVANGKIRERTPFVRTYVAAAGGDSGGAIGAAFAQWFGISREPRRFVMDHAYWGPGFDGGALIHALKARQADLDRAGCRCETVEDFDVLCRRVAAAIADGKVFGWFQGRMEWGPRALGNRSILADPRRADMKDVLNRKIKRRESFRPFAPSILRSEVGDWFEVDDDVPFMTQVYRIRPERRAQIPAVTHVDGTGRLQTVTRHGNPEYCSLIAQFQALTGVPMLLNTSFNENEPVVCRPEEALDCFLRTRMDGLVLGRNLVTRES